MSAVLVRQSLSLARAESERLQADQVRMCVDELQATMEAALSSDPLAVLGGTTSPVALRGARLTTDTGAVLAAGATPLPGALDSCRDGFNGVQHRVDVSLPNITRPTLEVTYGAEQGTVQAGRVVEYQLDSVSAMQVWSQELLDVSRLFAPGPDFDGESGEAAQPELVAGGDPVGAGLVGMAIPSAASDISTDLADLDEMVVTFNAPGNRRYRVTSVIYPLAATPAEVVSHQIVRNGTPIQGGLGVLANDTNVFTHELSVIDVPAAGRITYRTRARFGDTQGVNYSQGDFRPFLLVEDVGPAVLDDPSRVAPASGALGLMALAPDRAAAGFVPANPAQLSPIAGGATPAVAGPGQTMSVTFTPQAGRRYKVVSLVHPWAPGSAGAIFTHTVARQVGASTVPVRSGLVMAGNDVNAVSHLLEAIDVGPFDPATQVTYSTRLSVTGASGDTFNYSDAVLSPFLAVFDVGPAEKATTTDRPAGLLAFDGASPAGQLGADTTETASVTLSTDGTRMLRVVSSPQIASGLSGDVAVHRLGRNGLTLRSALVALDNNQNPLAHQVTAVELAPAGEVTYQTLLRFSAANTAQQGAVLSEGSFTPLLYVEDIGRVGSGADGTASVLAGAVYGAQGVVLPASSTTPTVLFGRSESHPDASPRHVQVISPQRDPGPSLLANLSTYTDVAGAEGRLPGVSGATGQISSDARARVAGTGGASGVPSGAPQMLLDTPQLVGQVADRINLACVEEILSAVCLQPGQLLLPEVSRARRPLGVVGFASPEVGLNSQIGTDFTTVAGQEVSLLSDGSRMYRITSTVNPLSLTSGEMLAHRIARNGIDIQGGLHPLDNTINVSSATLVSFDVPPAGLVTYASRARFATDADGTNVSASGVRPFLLVEDLGPSQGAEAPGDGSAGFKALASPPVSSSGYSQTPQPVSGQQVTFQAQAGRRYLVVSSVRPLSTELANVATHQIRRTGTAGTVEVASGVLALANTTNIGTHTIGAVVEPGQGPVTYTTFLSFAAGSGAQNVNYADTVHRPLLAVVDLGPSSPVPAASLSGFPGGLVAGPVAGGVASFVAAADRLYRVEFSATFSSNAPADAVRLDLVRVVAGQETVVQRGLLPAGTAGAPVDRTFAILDVPEVAAGTSVSYELRPVFADGVAVRTLATSLTVEDAGQGSAASGTFAVGGEVIGVVGSASSFRLPLGVVRASFATIDGQEFTTVPTEVVGQNVTFEAAGGRRYKITSVVHPYSDLSAGLSGEMVRHDIVRSATDSGRRTVQSSLHPLEVADALDTASVVVFDTPPQGRVTYATEVSFAEAGSVRASGESRSYIVVEDVGPAVEGVVADAAAGGLLGRVGYATPGSTSQVFASDWVDVAGQTVTIDAVAGRQYLVVSSVRPSADPSAGLGEATVAGHRLVRTVGGQDVVVSEHLVNLADSTSVFTHTFDHLDAPAVAGVVTYRTQLRFYSGAGRNFRDATFRPFLAVQDAGPTVSPSPPSPSTPEPAGVVAAVSPSATVSQTVSGVSGDVETVSVSVTVPGGRLYRVVSTAQPAWEETPGVAGPAVTFSHRLLRSVGGAETTVQAGAGLLPETGVAYSHRVEVVDAPAEQGASVTYRVVLTFPTGVGSSVVEGAFVPQLVVEDLGPASPDTTFGFASAAAPASLAGAFKPTLLTRVPDDATSYQVTMTPDEAGGTSLLVESCASLLCEPESVTSTFSLNVPSSGLVVIPGPTVLAGSTDTALTLIAGSVARPANLVVTSSVSFGAPVQLVATDRLLFRVVDGSSPNLIAADLVALGLNSSGTPLGSEELQWSAMLTLRGSIAAPELDIEGAFSAVGPVRIEPRLHQEQAPWAVGFVGEWRQARTRLAVPSEVQSLFSR
jgi:hypothetical protein